MSTADGKVEVHLPPAASSGGDVEESVAEAVEGLRADVMEKLEIEEAEEAKLTPEVPKPKTEDAKITPEGAEPSAEASKSTPEVPKPKTEEAEPSDEEAEPAALGSPGSNVAEKPLVEQAAALCAGEAKLPVEAAKAAAPPAAEKRRHRVILICFDDSEHSRRAVQFYVRGLSRPNDHVVLMHAIEAQEVLLPPHSMYMTSYVSPTFQEDLKLMKSKMTAKGVEFQALLKAAGVKSRIHVMDGPDKPGVYLVQKAAKLDANLIVIGSRGLGVVRRTFMGSVSDYVLHHAACATCVVPPQRRR